MKPLLKLLFCTALLFFSFSNAYPQEDILTQQMHFECGSVSGLGTGGYSMPMTNDTLRALVVFCNYPSPSGDFDWQFYFPNLITHQQWPRSTAQQKPSWADSVICPTTANIWDNSMTALVRDGTFGKYWLIGDVYKDLYIFKEQAEYYAAPGRKMGYATKELLENIDKDINYADYDKFDPWDLDTDGNRREPDGAVDFIFIIFRHHNSHIVEGLNNGYSGIACLGGRTRTFGEGGPTSITLDGKQIHANFPGSGSITEQYYHTGYATAVHEFLQHYNYGETHHDGLPGMNLNSGAYPSPDDRERLGWNTQGNYYEPTTNGTFTLRDYVTQGDYIKFTNLWNTVYIQNMGRRKFHATEGYHSWKWRGDIPIFPNQRDSGLLISRKYSANTFKTMHGFGKHNWLECNGKYTVSDYIFLNKFFPTTPNPYSGESPMDLRLKPVYDENCNRIFQYGSYRDELTSLSVGGDTNTMFEIGYNQVYSPWSNPGISITNPSDSLSIELIEREADGDLVVKVNFSNLTEHSPSKPQYLHTGKEYIPSTRSFHPKLSWLKNREPDMKKYKVYRGLITTAGADPASYTYLGETTDTAYTDNSILLYERGSGSGLCSYVHRKYSYRIAAVDSTEKVSVRSERDSVEGYSDPCAPHEMPYAENNLPKQYSLSQNYPNPFNPVTTISYDLPISGLVKLKVYDITGKEIANLVNEFKEAGSYDVVFNGSSFASGVYFYRIEAGGFTEIRRMVLVK